MALQPLIGIAGAIVVASLCASAMDPNGLRRHHQLRQELEEIRAHNAELQEQNDALAARVEGLRHDRAVIESVVRDHLGWVRANEVVVRFGGGGQTP